MGLPCNEESNRTRHWKVANWLGVGTVVPEVVRVHDIDIDIEIMVDVVVGVGVGVGVDIVVD